MKKTVLYLVLAFCLATLADASIDATMPARIVSLSPATTEILFALGLDEKIVGVSSFCDYPAAARSKEQVGSFSQPNIEKILSLKPDIVFCTGLEQSPVVTKLKGLGLVVYVSDPKNFKELFDSIEEMGRLTGKENEARTLVEKMKEAVANISAKVEKTPEHKKPRVFIEIWYDPLMTAGKDSFIDELIRTAGGINIAGDSFRPYGSLSSEIVLARDPDIIILTYMTRQKPVELLEARFGWKTISAVAHKKVFDDIDSNLILRPGPRSAEGLKEIHKRLYGQ